MKNILIGAYILIVLLISAFAKAEQISVTSAQYSAVHNLLKISGNYFGICFNKVRPSLESVTTIQQNVDVSAKLALLSPGPCVSQFRRIPFEMAVDTRSLGIPAGQKVSIELQNSAPKMAPIEIEVSQEIEFDFSQMTNTYGRVVAIENARFAVLRADGRLVKISGPFDFSKYLGHSVLVRGLELSFQVMSANADVDFVAPMSVLSIFDLN